MRVILTFLLLGFSLSISAQNTNQCNCCKEPYRQFDFWIGEWEVKDSSGKLLGYNSIKLEEDSCTLRENWTGATGGTGTSLSFYIRSKESWHQTWVDKFGGSILMDGKWENGSMVLYTEKVTSGNDEKYIQNRTSWTPLPDGKVHHVWKRTKDGGKSWIIVFDGYYHKKNKK